MAGPRFAALPAGWAYSCGALQCAVELADAVADPDVRWYETTPDYALDLEAIVAYHPVCRSRRPAVEECSVSADFDGDGKTDALTPIQHAPSFRPGLAIAWGNGREMSTVGTDTHGHVSAADGRSACSNAFEAMVVGNQLRGVEELSVVDAAAVLPEERGAHRRSALRLPGETWLFFDGDAWRNARFDKESGEDRLEDGRPWVNEALPPACETARSIRSDRYLGHDALMWHPADRVAKGTCTHEADFDGDGTPEPVAWVVEHGKAGLKIDGFQGRTAQFGAGRRSVAYVLDDEPGCNKSYDSLNDIWEVGVAQWDGSAWTLPDGRRHAPSDPSVIGGAALALTNAHGHVDLIVLSNGEWQSAAVPFDWDRYYVFWPAREQWNWIPKPSPATRRYARPTPARRAWVEKHTPGPPPKSVRFYPGR